MASTPTKSNVAWGMLLGWAGTIDIVQIFLDGYAIGIVVNRFIDIGMGLFLLFVFFLMGVKLTFWRIISILLSFLLEEIPVLDAAPFWAGDVAFVWASVRMETATYTQEPDQDSSK